MAARPDHVTARGNAKLGRGIWHTNLTAGDACPGASTYCADVCYAKRGFYVLQRERYGTLLEYLREDPAGYLEILKGDLDKLPIGGVFRFHTSGDIDSLEHVEIIRAACEHRPDVAFYLYTRSWRVPELRAAIGRRLLRVPNLTVWASTDPTTGPAPRGWRDAGIFPDHDAARAAGRPVCPEQTGMRPDCTSCGLCWRARKGATLAFLEH